MIFYECDRCHKRAPAQPETPRDTQTAYFNVHQNPPPGWVCAHHGRTVIVTCSPACYKRQVEFAPKEAQPLLLRVLDGLLSDPGCRTGAA